VNKDSECPGVQGPSVHSHDNYEFDSFFQLSLFQLSLLSVGRKVFTFEFHNCSWSWC